MMRMDSELHRQMKLYAILENKTVYELYKQVVKQYLENAFKEQKGVRTW